MLSSLVKKGSFFGLILNKNADIDSLSMTVLLQLVWPFLITRHFSGGKKSSENSPIQYAQRSRCSWRRTTETRNQWWPKLVQNSVVLYKYSVQVPVHRYINGSHCLQGPYHCLCEFHGLPTSYRKAVLVQYLYQLFPVVLVI